ncbi:type VI secretion system-associated protein TagF [Lichenibacterium ramalinae]|uniref:type VI secretion system-associated protein TagF n=1 Tax=Lichenibacterium ramalinae TaxID=2316527 RepID=UPI0013E9EFB3|nr:type VI secretion system-associated protein TagF [Lichenibacterium ramalinae]
MTDGAAPGFFGKIAARGDFVSRRIDGPARAALDAWLSAAVVASRRALGGSWLGHYAAAPAWRFALAAGAAGPEPLAGVMVASQDGAGRQFPLVIAARLPGDASLYALCRHAAAWFDVAEEAAAAARSKTLDLDAFDARVAALGGPPAAPPGEVEARRLPFGGDVARAAALADALELALVGRPAPEGPPATLWWTREGGPAPASLLLHAGLPAPDRFAALLDGRWARWGWDEPAAAPPVPDAPAPAGPVPAGPVPHGPLRSAARTHRGTHRPSNQDAALERPDLGLWAVADGAGGHDDGAAASAAVIARLGGFAPALSFASALTEIEELLGEANDALRARARSLGPERMVAAVVVALFVHGGHYAVVWAGDSRAYLLRDGDAVRLTRDHVSEDARYVTRAVGAANALMVDVARGTVLPGDRFVLCSDGLVKATGAAVLDAALRPGPPAVAAAALIEDALIAGASDNVTALVVDVGTA